MKKFKEFKKWFDTIFTVLALILVAVNFVAGQFSMGMLWGLIASHHLLGVESLWDQWSDEAGDDYERL